MPAVLTDIIEMDTSALVADLQAWLPTATDSQLLEYVRLLSPDDKLKVAAAAPNLVGAVRHARSAYLRRTLGSNVASVLPEPVLLQFMADLTAYNPQSVIRQYTQQYPQLRVQAEAVPGNLQEWARSEFVKWYRVFQFLGALLLDQHLVYLKALIKANITQESATTLLKEGRLLQDQVYTLLLSSNFDVVVYPQDLQSRLTAFFSQLSFIPRQDIQELISGRADRRLANILRLLTYNLEVLSLTETNPGESLEAAAIRALWSRLQLDQEIFYTKQYEISRLSNRPVPKDENYNRVYKLAKQISLPYLMSGTLEQSLLSYLSSLSSEQRAQVVQEIERVIAESPEMQVLMEPWELSEVLPQLRDRVTSGREAEYFQEIQSRLNLQLWPYAEKLLSLLSKIYRVVPLHR
jgi:hypothetical protein